MKLNLKYLIIFLLLLYFCSDNTVTPTKSMSELITKKWKVESSYINGEKNPWAVTDVFDFRADSTLVKYEGIGDVILNGIWSIDEINRTLKIKYQNIPSWEEFFIIKLDENNLCWTYPWWGKNVEDNLVPF